MVEYGVCIISCVSYTVGLAGYNFTLDSQSGRRSLNANRTPKSGLPLGGGSSIPKREVRGDVLSEERGMRGSEIKGGGGGAKGREDVSEREEEGRRDKQQSEDFE